MNVMLPACHSIDTVDVYLHHLLLVVELGHQHVFSICNSGEGDSQSPAGMMVTIGRQSASQHVSHNLHQVKGGMHRPQESLSRLFGNLDDVCTSLSCETRKANVGGTCCALHESS